MKTNVLISLKLGFLLILCTQGFSLAAPAEDEIVLPNMPRISAEELKKMIDKGADIVIVDTRDGGSYEFGHIKGAVNIYFDPTGDPMNRQMTLIALPMDKLIVTYCDWADDKNSASMAQELYQLGYDLENIKILAGGSIRWEELKYPLVDSN